MSSWRSGKKREEIIRGNSNNNGSSRNRRRRVIAVVSFLPAGNLRLFDKTAKLLLVCDKRDGKKFQPFLISVKKC